MHLVKAARSFEQRRCVKKLGSAELYANESDQPNKLNFLTAQLETYKNQMQKIQEDHKDQQNKLNILTAQLETYKNQMQKIQEDHKEVAFSAALQPSSWGNSGYGKMGPFGTDITLAHGKILTNVGGAYSNKGVFTAPVKGVYFFTFTTYSWAAEADIGVKLMKNNEEVLLVWETQDKGDNEDYASNSVLLELEVGDKVYMRLPKGYQVAASKYSNIHTFSGFLLYSRARIHKEF
ncbi:cerebellin-3-like [Sardina pilchardus]|uniref:cerebellin-3-like n=1 Tax=Sardina pilchardus TaxID=27697 RepID=UPI002E0FD4BE